MTTMTLETLGFTKEELQEKLLDRLTSEVLSGVSYDEDGDPFSENSDFANKLNERVKAHIDAVVDGIAQKHVLPNVSQYIENLTLQERTKWGEKVGEPMSFIEYLIKRAEAYLNEQVSYEGKSKSEDSYNWRGTQTRITHLVHQHLHYSIQEAMKNAVQMANSAIATGIQESVRLKLGELSTAIKIGLETKSR